jgi:hypothetical protein
MPNLGEWLIVRLSWLAVLIATWIGFGFWGRFIFELAHIGWRGAGIFLK